MLQATPRRQVMSVGCHIPTIKNFPQLPLQWTLAIRYNVSSQDEEHAKCVCLEQLRYCRHHGCIVHRLGDIKDLEGMKNANMPGKAKRREHHHRGIHEHGLLSLR